MTSDAGESQHAEGVPVRLEQVTKSFGRVEVLRALDLDVTAGEFVTLLGPSGCGKSTTLNIIAGLESPTSGRVHVGGDDVTDVPPQRRDIAMVFQSYALYPHLTVFENIAFPLRLRRRRVPQAEIDGRVRTVAESLELAGLLDRVPGEISGGQRQRVALGRAVVRSPRAFLFDEPLSNLDNRLRVGMRSALKELHGSLGATMIYVTHDQAEAMVMSDRIVVMNDGIIQQVGAPLDLYDRPTNVFVARFLGDRGVNLLRGSFHADGEFESTWGRVRLPARYPASGPVLLGVRPENLRLDPDGGVFRGELKTVEPMGNHTFVRVSNGEDDVAASAPIDYRGEAGTIVGLSVGDLQTVSVFDAATQIRLTPESRHAHV